MRNSVLISTYKDFVLLEVLEKCLLGNMIAELSITRQDAFFKVEYETILNNTITESHFLLRELNVFKKAIFNSSIVDFELKFDYINNIYYVNKSFKEGFVEDSDSLLDVVELLTKANMLLKNINLKEQNNIYIKQKVKGKYVYSNVSEKEMIETLIDNLSNQ